MHKICSTCKENKLLDEFSKNIKSKDGYQNQCKNCTSKFYSLNRESRLKSRAKYKQENASSVLNYQKEYNKRTRKANRKKYCEYYKDYYKKYRQNNRAKINSIVAKRRAAKLKATPNWLTIEDRMKIQEFYEIAQAFRLYTGQEYHVDHIVPLQGKNICGLHVPWNLQVISATENIKKSNKF